MGGLGVDLLAAWKKQTQTEGLINITQCINPITNWRGTQAVWEVQSMFVCHSESRWACAKRKDILFAPPVWLTSMWRYFKFRVIRVSNSFCTSGYTHYQDYNAWRSGGFWMIWHDTPQACTTMSLNDGDREDSKLKSEPMQSLARISPCEDMTNLIHLQELDLS